jgi:transcriptional regulator GlxA family with amidase domain
MPRRPDTEVNSIGTGITPVLIVATPGVLLLDLAGVAEPFRLANEWAKAQNLIAPFALEMIGAQSSVHTSLPLTLAGLKRPPTRIPRGAWIVLSGTASSATVGMTRGEDPVVSRWLVAQVAPLLAKGDARLWTVCSGAFFAARAGLLDGRQCTTHHSLVDELAALRPAARVHANRIFVVDGPVATSAGITAGIDLALFAIAQRIGQAGALAVARELVVFHRRAGGDPQLSATLRHRNHLHPAVHRAQDAVLQAPATAWTVARLADAAHVTPRHLARLFHEHAGVAPLDYLQQVRLELARALMSDGALDMERVAERSGFSSAHHLRRVWRREQTALPAFAG